MTKRKKGMETVFEIVVPVPAYIVENCLLYVQECIDDETEWSPNLDELKANETVMKYVREHITDTVDLKQHHVDAWVNWQKLKRELKPDLAKWSSFRQAEVEAEERAAAEANRLEEERLMREGRSIAIPAKQAKRAEDILRAAGINFKLLP